MKWVEVEALSTITEAKIQNFMLKNIICKFGIQWTTVRQPRFQELLLKIGDQEPILISRTSTRQWTDESDKPNSTEDHQSSAKGGEGRMAEGIA